MSKVTEEIDALDRLREREREVAELWRSGTDELPRVTHEFFVRGSLNQRHFARGARAAYYEAERMMCRRARVCRVRSATLRGARERACCKLAQLTPAQALIRAAHERRMKSGPTDEQLAARWGAAWSAAR